MAESTGLSGLIVILDQQLPSTHLANSNLESHRSPQALLRCFIDSNPLIHLHYGYQFLFKVCKQQGGSSPQSIFYVPNNPILSVSEPYDSETRDVMG